MSTGQPLVVLLHVCQAGPAGLFGAQGGAHGSLSTALRVQLAGAHLPLTRPLSCWIPVFMPFTAVHRPTG